MREVILATKNKFFIANILLLLFFTILSLVGAEMFIRFTTTENPFCALSAHNKLFCEYDPLLGWKKIPNATGRHVTTEYAIHESFNSKGLRGPEYSYKKRKGQYRILALGDSFTEGYSVKFSDLFSEVLKQKLNNSSSKLQYEVINAGTGGYSTDQELLFFRGEGKKYNPDLTILLFYDNDVPFNTRGIYGRGNKPFFKLEEGGLSLKNVPVPRPKAEAKDAFIPSIKKWFAGNSFLYHRVNDAYYHIKYYIDNIGHKKQKTVKRQVALPAAFETWGRKYNLENNYDWQVTSALLGEIKKEADSIGSKFLVFYVPTRASAYPDVWEATRKKYGLSDEEWSAEQSGIVLENICKINKIDFINPTEEFRIRGREIKSNESNLYYPLDGHWNFVGHKLAAEILFKYITN